MDRNDAGLAVVRFIAERMQVDAQWCVWERRGFTWWAANLAQHVLADEPFEEDGSLLCRVHLQTDFLTNFEATDDQLLRLAELTPLVTTSGFVRASEDKKTLRLATSIYVHEQVRPWMQELLAWIAPMQIMEAAQYQLMLGTLGEDRAIMARSAHPSSGPRLEPDEMLGLTELVVKPAGQEPSRWAGQDCIDLGNLFQRPPCLLATGDSQGITAEFPFPWHTCLLRVWTNQPHPSLGNGCLMLLTLPHGTKSAESMREALALNDMETHDQLTRAYFLGSWCASDQGLTFVSFLPNALFAQGAVLSLGLSMARRARAVCERLHDYDWDANFEKDFERKMQSLLGTAATPTTLGSLGTPIKRRRR